MYPLQTPYKHDLKSELDCRLFLAKDPTCTELANVAKEDLTSTQLHMQAMTGLTDFFTSENLEPPSGQKAQDKVDGLKNKQRRLRCKSATKEEWHEHILEIQSLQQEVLVFTTKLEKFHRAALWCHGCGTAAISPVMMHCDGASKEILVCVVCAHSGEFSGSIRDDEQRMKIAARLWTNLDYGSRFRPT